MSKIFKHSFLFFKKKRNLGKKISGGKEKVGKKRKMRNKSKRGLSPVIATALLISIAVVLAIIIFLWARGFIKEVVEKEIGGVKKTAEKFCPEVNFDVAISGDSITVLNNANIPIYKIDIKKQKKGVSYIEEQVVNLGVGGSKRVSATDLFEYDKIIIIPVLLGKSGNSQKEYPCKEEYGVECLKEDNAFVC